MNNIKVEDLKEAIRFLKTVDKTIKITDYKTKKSMIDFLESVKYDFSSFKKEAPSAPKPATAPKPAKPPPAPKPATAPKPLKAPKPPSAPKPATAPKPLPKASASAKAPEIKLEPVKKSKDDAFKDLLKTTFTRIPKDHPLDPEQVAKFLEKCDPKVRAVTKKILDNTDVISFEEFTSRIHKLLNDMLKMISGNIVYCYISLKGEILTKSNYWLYQYVVLFLHHYTDGVLQIKPIDNLNQITEEKANLMIIDDCVYSGDQMSSTIAGINIDSGKKVNIDIYMIVPYISDSGRNKVKSFFNKNDNLKKVSKMIFLKDTYTIKQCKSIITDADKTEFNELLKYFPPIASKHLIYFYHKLADLVSVPTYLYLGFVPNELNGKPITTAKSKMIIPIIKNCKHYTKNIDIMSPKCPFPPYKKEIDKIIK